MSRWFSVGSYDIVTMYKQIVEIRVEPCGQTWFYRAVRGAYSAGKPVSYTHLDVYKRQQGDMATGPWWLYESENNEACKTAGFCPAVDETPIQDQDQFTFKYTDSY